MILSRLLLNPRSRQVQRELTDPYQMHRTILRAFPTPLPEQERVLYRFDISPHSNELLLLVQSHTSPDWSFLQEHHYLQTTSPFDPGGNPAMKTVRLNLTVGQYLHFRLRANPTQSQSSERKEGEKRPRGHRVALYKEEEQQAWLKRQATAHGFHILYANINKHEPTYSTIRRQEQKHEVKLNRVQFDGLLQVTAPAALLQAVYQGIGPAKAFGCGLLSLAPA